ncbi:MAG: ribonuclease III [Candidatus Cloacimonetes bacterium]|nr:ribonuclease III [Candidatus Cloacimonadota bacterium]
MKRVLRSIIEYLVSRGGADTAIEPAWSETAQAFQARIGYTFDNVSLLHAAMTHLSHFRRQAENAHSTSAFERMEFLGDSILGLVVAEELFMRYPDSPEGKLSKLKSKIVSETFLALKASDINLGQCLLLSGEEDRAGGRNRSSILSDAMESLICAIYLDSNLTRVRRFIKNHILKDFETAVTHVSLINFKSILQEFTQSRYQNTPEYVVTHESGPDHRKTFTVEALINDERQGSGRGSSKKLAEQSAARDACRQLKLK